MIFPLDWLLNLLTPLTPKEPNMKVADVKLTWTKSPSPDVARQVLKTVIAGSEATVELGPEAQEFMVTISSDTPFQFSVDTFDAAGNHTVSEVYSSAVGDLEAPLAATNLAHEIVAVRDATPPG